MKWLFWQSWLLLLVSFLLGAFLTWLFLVRPRRAQAARPPSVAAAPAAAAGPAPEPAEPADEDATADGIVVRPRTRAEPVEEHVVTMPATPDDDTTTPSHGFSAPRHADAATEDADTVVLDAHTAAGRHARPVESPDFEGAVLPRADGTAPSGGYRVKARADSMLYHEPGAPGYRSAKAEVWFRDAQTAEDAGFRPWNWRDRVSIRRPARGGASAEPAVRSATNGHGRPRNGMARAIEDGAYPGSAKAVEGGAPPSDDFVVKASEDSMLYHTAESPAFASTRAEVWFRTEADARRAGFAPWRNLR